MRLMLLRHAEVEARYAGCYNGHNSIGLSPEGQIVANRLCEALNAEAFDAVYASDLPRVRQTLQGLKHTVHYTQKLREKSWGRHEGLRYDEVAAMEGAEYENFAQWLKVLDGEAYPRYIARIRTFFEALVQTGHEKVLVATHAGVIRVFFHLLYNEPLEAAFARPVGFVEPIVLNVTYDARGMVCEA